MNEDDEKNILIGTLFGALGCLALVVSTLFSNRIEGLIRGLLLSLTVGSYGIIAMVNKPHSRAAGDGVGFAQGMSALIVVTQSGFTMLCFSDPPLMIGDIVLSTMNFVMAIAIAIIYRKRFDDRKFRKKEKTWLQNHCSVTKANEVSDKG